MTTQTTEQSEIIKYFEEKLRLPLSEREKNIIGETLAYKKIKLDGLND